MYTNFRLLYQVALEKQTHASFKNVLTVECTSSQQRDAFGGVSFPYSTRFIAHSRITKYEFIFINCLSNDRFYFQTNSDEY